MKDLAGVTAARSPATRLIKRLRRLQEGGGDPVPLGAWLDR